MPPANGRYRNIRGVVCPRGADLSQSCKVVKGPRLIREEFYGDSEPPCPAPKALHKTRPWVPIVLVVFAGLAVAHIAGLTKPLLQLAGAGSHPPGWRLVGDWESDNDPMFRRFCYAAAKDGKGANGVILGHADRGTGDVIYHVVSEDRSGRNLELAEYLPGVDYNYRARYSITEDGKSMTREYTARNGSPVSCQYRYLGPPTETPY